VVVLLVAWAVRRVRHKLDDPAFTAAPSRTGDAGR